MRHVPTRALLILTFFVPIFAERCPAHFTWLASNVTAIESAHTVAEALNRNASHVRAEHESLTFMTQLEQRQSAGDPDTGGLWACERTRDLSERVQTVDQIMQHRSLGRVTPCLSIIGDDDVEWSKGLFRAVHRFSDILGMLTSTLQEYDCNGSTLRRLKCSSTTPPTLIECAY